jgi:hypothetical protein
MAPGCNEMDTRPSPPYRRASSFENRMLPYRRGRLNKLESGMSRGDVVFTNLLWPYNLAVPSFFRAASESFPGASVAHRIPSGAPK